MVSLPVDLVREPTEDDVLRIDPVREYDRRKVWREFSNELFAQVGDGNDELLERGRPTGP